MADTTYTYYGPLSAVTLAADADHPKGRNVQLARGLKVSLPDDNEYVKSLVARKYLVPVEGENKSATATASATSAAASTPTATPEATSGAAATSAPKTAETASATSAATGA